MSQRYDQLVRDARDGLARAEASVNESDELLGLDTLVALSAAETYATLALADAVHRIALSKGAH